MKYGEGTLGMLDLTYTGADLALETDFLQGLASHRTTERTPEASSSSWDR